MELQIQESKRNKNIEVLQGCNTFKEKNKRE
jgi:hypothetical protein